jgi:hypothetical protein
MTVPGRIEAAHLLRSLDPPDWFLRHSRAVAEVAAFLAARTALRGIPIDRRLAESAALLHDVDKTLPASNPLRTLPHGQGSARWLEEHGCGELGPAVAGHPITRLLDGTWFEEWLGASRPEERIVAYADKRARQRIVSLDARFASWRRRYPRLDVEGRTLGWDDAAMAEVRDRAGRLEALVCDAAGIRPDGVRRLSWTAAALRATTTASAA